MSVAIGTVIRHPRRGLQEYPARGLLYRASADADKSDARTVQSRRQTPPENHERPAKSGVLKVIQYSGSGDEQQISSMQSKSDCIRV